MSTASSAADQQLNNLPYVPLFEYNNTESTGGDSLHNDLNIYYQAGDIAWMLISTALVLLMIPGVGFFYSGLARRKSALSLIWLSIMSVAVISFQWFFWGYSLAFSHNANFFIGNLDNIGLRNVLAAPSVGSDKIPDIVFALYQGMFACITVALAVGAVAERGRMLPCIVFMFVWSTVVYDPIACWTWNANGWAAKLGGLDFAGGTPVHIASGAAALAYSYALGKRAGHGTQALNFRPHNITHIVVGTVFLWVGWFGFNAGSAMSANLRAVMAALVTNLSASVGGITWCLVDYRLEGKWSVVGFCSGIVAGLVAITPAAGYVPAWSAVPIGIIAGIGCNFATQLKYWISADDALDIFAVHGVGGVIGNILTAFFAADYIAHLDGVTEIEGGWLNQNWKQLGFQLADSAAGMTYSFVLSIIILYLINLIGRVFPCMRLRANAHEQELGIDDVELGEFAYDYVELIRDVKPHSMMGEEYDEDDAEAQSQRSHSQVTMMPPEKGGSYPLRSLSRGPADSRPRYEPGVGIAS